MLFQNKLSTSEQFPSETYTSSDAELIAQSGLFSLDFYCAQLAHPVVGWSAAVEHYLQQGVRLLVDPHPLFDTGFYTKNSEDVDFEAVNPLVHFLREGWLEGRNPHPLIDLDFYQRTNPDIEASKVNPLLQYIHSGALEGRPLCRFFDRKRYAEQLLSDSGEVPLDLLSHFIERGASSGLIPHPIFFRVFGFERPSEAGSPEVSIASHAKFKRLFSNDIELSRLEREKRDFEIIHAAQIFDRSHFLRQVDEKALSLEECIDYYLVHCLEGNLDPLPLFDSDYYVDTNADVDFEVINPFAHFLSTGWKENRNPHPLFDMAYYRSHDEAFHEADVNPLVHFVQIGASELRDTSPLFRRDDYLRSLHKARRRKHRIGSRLKANMMRSLSASGGDTLVPRVPTGRISSRFLLPDSDNLVAHFLGHGLKDKIYPYPSFEFFFNIISLTPDRDLNHLRLRNFSNEHEFSGCYQSFAKQLSSAKFTEYTLVRVSNLLKYLKFKRGAERFLNSDRVMLLTVHQASRSGAPLLLLRLIKDFVKKGWECIIVLDEKGPIESEFLEYAHVLSIDQVKWLGDRTKRAKKAEELLNVLFDELAFSKPGVCILNSMETGPHAPALKALGLRTVCLVHEIVDSYELAYVKSTFENCERLVFPSMFVRDQAVKKVGAISMPHSVLPSALLNRKFGTYNRKEARTDFRDELCASEDDFIILACANPDLRKGVDLFVMIAKQVLLKNRSRKLRFVWIGADDRVPHTALYYARWDIKQAGIESQVTFIPSKPDIEKAFVGSDLFVLPSRQDPFPCVVHDAMAAQLPVIAFDGAGGMNEMLEGGGAHLVPYGDIASFADSILFYATNDEIRQLDGEKNRKLVLQRFRFEDYAENVLEICLNNNQTFSVASL
jgi:glycosyltransferase involved in cell wall biosynthesis